jgi:hypothetical protein
MHAIHVNLPDKDYEGITPIGFTGKKMKGFVQLI